jgi:hypothetical protein
MKPIGTPRHAEPLLGYGSLNEADLSQGVRRIRLSLDARRRR